MLHGEYADHDNVSDDDHTDDEDDNDDKASDHDDTDHLDDHDDTDHDEREETRPNLPPTNIFQFHALAGNLIQWIISH